MDDDCRTTSGVDVRTSSDNTAVVHECITTDRFPQSGEILINLLDMVQIKNRCERYCKNKKKK